MPQAVWTGTLGFGLVSVPVRLVPATEAKDVRFHLYDREGRRVRYRRVVEAGDAEPSVPQPAPPPASEVPRAPDEPVAVPDDAVPAPTSEADVPTGSRPPASPADRMVDWGEIVRGRETDAGDLVLLSDEEIDRVRPRRSGTIDVEAFVELGDIDPVHFEKTYYAVPRSAADAKPYALLHRAMRRAGRVGIGRFVLRTKPHLVAVRAMEELLAVHTLFFGDEVRDPRVVSPPLDVRVSARRPAPSGATDEPDDAENDRSPEQHHQDGHQDHPARADVAMHPPRVSKRNGQCDVHDSTSKRSATQRV